MSKLASIVLSLSLVSLGAACAEQKGRKKDDDDKKADKDKKDSKTKGTKK